MGLGAHLWGSHGSEDPTYGSGVPLMGLGSHLWVRTPTCGAAMGLKTPLMGLGAHLWGSHGSEDPTYGSEGAFMGQPWV